MKLYPIGVALVVLGMLLIVGSFAWFQLLPRDAVWTEDQAVAYQKIAYEYHHQTFDKSIDKLTLAKTKAEYESQREQLDNARSLQAKIPIYLRVFGVGVLVIGVSLMYTPQTNRNSHRDPRVIT